MNEKWSKPANNLYIETAIGVDSDDMGTASLLNSLEAGMEAQVVIETHKGPITTRLIKAVLTVLGIEVSYNLTTRKMEINGVPDKYSKAEASNTLPVLILDYLTEKHIKAGMNSIIQRLHVIADMNRFNPVIDMIRKTVWDGQDRIGSLFEILGLTDIIPESQELSEKKKRYRLYVTKWLHQCVAMALNDEEDPYGADGVLVLQGEQGIGKTLFFRIISVESLWFMGGISLNMSKKDELIKATGKWIAELGELDDTLARKQSSFKAFLTAERDEIRSPYARTAVNKPRRTSFCGTVNPERFLYDETGSRRFWVVKVQEVDVESLLSLSKEWLYQLWAQVYQERYLPNPQGFRLTRSEEKQLQEDNLEFLMPMAGEIEMLEALNWDAPIGQWRYIQAGQLKKMIDGVNSSQVGKIVRRIQKRDHRIKIKNAHNHIIQFLLPPMVNSELAPSILAGKSKEELDIE